MSEGAILMSAELAPLVVSGQKTQTRRVVKPQPPTWLSAQLASGFRQIRNIDGNLWGAFAVAGNAAACRLSDTIRCPYGRPGDRLHMLTRWAVYPFWDKLKPSDLPTTSTVWNASQGPKPKCYGKSRPGMFCPSYLRHHLPLIEITGVRCERVQDISEEDAKAEGVRPTEVYGEREPNATITTMPPRLDYRLSFERLWDRVCAENHPWDSNPLVWVLEFKHVEKAR